MPTVHTFDSTGEAYDASQTHDDIKDGDVLAVPSEQVVGILVQAWPTAVGERTGAFHSLDTDKYWWDAVPGVPAGPGSPTPTRDYSESFSLAVDTLDDILLDQLEEKERGLRTWRVVVPAKDADGRIVRWLPKMVIPRMTKNDALRVAREQFGPAADIREER